jgi:hypothetical protein
MAFKSIVSLLVAQTLCSALLLSGPPVAAQEFPAPGKPIVFVLPMPLEGLPTKPREI